MPYDGGRRGIGHDRGAPPPPPPPPIGRPRGSGKQRKPILAAPPWGACQVVAVGLVDRGSCGELDPGLFEALQLGRPGARAASGKERSQSCRQTGGGVSDWPIWQRSRTRDESKARSLGKQGHALSRVFGGESARVPAGGRGADEGVVVRREGRGHPRGLVRRGPTHARWRPTRIDRTAPRPFVDRGP